MTDTYTPRSGDHVEASKGDALFRALVAEASDGSGRLMCVVTGVDFVVGDVNELIAQRWTFSRLADPIPTEPGIYLDKSNDPCVVDEDGELTYKGESMRAPGDFGPFRRIEYTDEAEARVVRRLAEALYIRGLDDTRERLIRVAHEVLGVIL
jgi:hypothetical protein